MINKMIKPLVIENILVDLYYNGIFQFTVSDFTLLDIRRQIAKYKLIGYSVKMNPNFYRLFAQDDDIENSEYFISEDGVYSDWFPNYYISDEYPSVGVFTESLSVVLKMNQARSYSI